MTDYSPPEDLLIALQESLGDTESFSFALSRGWVPYNASTSPAWGDWLLNNLAPLIFQHHGDKYHLFIANVVVHLCRYIEDENAGTEIGITPRLAIYLQKIMLRMIKRVNALAGDRFSKASDESKLRIQECRDFVSEDTWKWICEIFDIDIGLHEKLDRVRNLVKKQKLAQAASLATDYMVQCYLGEEELLIPLAKKKMFQNIFQFLEGNAFSQVDQQKLGKLQSLAVDLVFKESNSDKFPLKMIKGFRLDVANFPKVLQSARLRVLKEYVKNKKIEEFAHEITAGDPYLEKECLRMCLKNKLEDAFIKLCKTYHYEFDPEFFRSYEQISCEEKSLFFSSNSDAILRCNNPVYFIDDMESFEQAKNKLLSTATPPRLLAIDCEQKIKLFEFESRKIVLLQLSTEHFNFIFDMLKFRMYSTEWSALFQMLFLDTDLLKIGFGIPGDFCILHKKFKDVSDCFLILKNCFDVYSFETKNKELSNVSLKSLCFELFKLELSKVECVSDWMRRPLRPSQLEYAALDAEILIRLFQHYSQNYLPSDLGVGIRDTMRFD